MMLPTEKTPIKQKVTDLTSLLYGQSKIGKSSFCSRAEGTLFLATEPGLNSLDVFQVPISSWEDLLNACNEIASGKHAFQAIVIDTVDNAYPMCTDYICKKHNILHPSDLAYGKAYAQINTEFHRVLNRLALLPYGLFLISHAQEREYETRTGKRTRITPTLPDKVAKIVLGLVDLILYCDIEVVQGEDGKPGTRRVIRTKPSPEYAAGDRTGKLPEVIPLDYKAFVEAFNAGGGEQ
ncbi:MAG: ATP-binding protein [Planctomycetota bacterium]